MKKIILLTLFVSQVFAIPVIDLGYDKKSTANQFGKIFIKHSDSNGDSLYLNSTRVNLGKEGNSFTLIMLSQVNFPDASSYIVLGGSGGTMDMDSNVACKFVTVKSRTSYIVSALTYCPGNYQNAVTAENNLIIVKFPNTASYAESNDIGTLSYDLVKNKIEITTHLKRDSYYRKKFANYTPAGIYQEAATDGNVDKETGLLMTCHICGMYGYKYCFKFKSLVNPPHDKYYSLLQKSCS